MYFSKRKCEVLLLGRNNSMDMLMGNQQEINLAEKDLGVLMDKMTSVRLCSQES